ncbi:type II toxin-antitoxin system CcdA family antitoxin [Gluconacetobacter asukensis]|nr:type II toxin-antitoxin system CcdA family antitoxin [Gluconacetobacter asukensis]
MRRPTNVTLPPDLLAEARALDLNISQACAQGLAAAIASVRARQWLAENREALESSRRYVEENGLPLADFRTF